MNPKSRAIDKPLNTVRTTNQASNPSPALTTKDMNILKPKFYTPGLDKHISNEKLASFVELRYLNKKLQSSSIKDKTLNRTANTKTLTGILKENNDSLNYSNDEIDTIKVSITTDVNNREFKAEVESNNQSRKLYKINSLFNVECFNQTDLNYVSKSWYDLANAYEIVSKGKNPINNISSMIAALRVEIIQKFLSVFTDYNQIKQKIGMLYFMKLWALFVFIYINEKAKYNIDIKTRTWFEAILHQLLQSAFYVSLIISKAMRNGIINKKNQEFEGLSKYLHKFQFPTGVPLVKTLKTNIDNIHFSIKNVLNNTNKTIGIQFEKSYLRNLDNTEAYLNTLVSTFYPLFKSSYRELLNKAFPAIVESDLNTIHEKNKAKQPFITEPLKNKKYTIVFDLDETLIHFKADKLKSKFLIRPHAYNILRNLSPYFEIIIFTAAQKEYADFILNILDTQKVIAHRLYRDSCIMEKDGHIKVR